ncbi:Uncharacterised protein [uncultured archaeon]|nr:Uncharacterised protein [uncultured archaeon]
MNDLIFIQYAFYLLGVFAGTIQKFSDSVIFHDENQNNLVTNQPP